ncbi:hypothetical protein BDZ94DRAFT_1258876 [Collybia nuda]|uniref:Uncharacterized protein n=1 Tax=Collybia nuda TaxID=64659 RepID=A0A9P5Y778_9AGAR|nr:hypothetical protein BDZ94DRAFT_1258876 [Collybia nuda]
MHPLTPCWTTQNLLKKPWLRPWQARAKPWLRAWPWPEIPSGQSPLEPGQSQGFQAKPGPHIATHEWGGWGELLSVAMRDREPPAMR